MSHQSKLRVVPSSIQAANEFVELHHRHHPPLQAMNYRFCLAVVDEGGVVRGVAIVARPAGGNRMTDGDLVAEVARVATDGTANACSSLYGAAARAARAMGYSRIITYILDSEPGVSLKASGWRRDPGLYGGQSWKNHPRPGYDRHPLGPKGRWSLELNPYVETVWPEPEPSAQGVLV